VTPSNSTKLNARLKCKPYSMTLGLSPSFQNLHRARLRRAHHTMPSLNLTYDLIIASSSSTTATFRSSATCCNSASGRANGSTSLVIHRKDGDASHTIMGPDTKLTLPMDKQRCTRIVQGPPSMPSTVKHAASFAFRRPRPSFDSFHE
jgi:hypothetical protein